MKSAFALFSFQGTHPLTYTALDRVRYISLCGEFPLQLRPVMNNGTPFWLKDLKVMCGDFQPLSCSLWKDLLLIYEVLFFRNF